ncbi:MAG: hypothetical protein ETSY2_51740 [Candidatus Entotheonella gemina]|uniref:Tc1-like transposase DDE domain-containing protein n=1 Tax=Candidatus Entotheonella gemina TaxID=1429439 RepID=W4L5U3_9BACT|nr:MAG: hypothetical protein ETSY2_51740 [Candidatus Entotheonella gemina]
MLLCEIQDDLLNVLMIEVDVATICRFLYDSGFSRHKLCRVALQRDQILRDKFIMDVSLYDPNMLIFLDETGADRRNALRQYGYSMCGKPLKKYSLLCNWNYVC